MVPMPSREVLFMTDPSRRDAVSAGNSMIVPMSSQSPAAAPNRPGRQLFH